MLSWNIPGSAREGLCLAAKDVWDYLQIIRDNNLAHVDSLITTRFQKELDDYSQRLLPHLKKCLVSIQLDSCVHLTGQSLMFILSSGLVQYWKDLEFDCLSWKVLEFAILSSIENVCVLSNPFPSKPSIVFSPQKPFYSQPNYSSWQLGIFWCLFQAI